MATRGVSVSPIALWTLTVLLLVCPASSAWAAEHHEGGGHAAVRTFHPPAPYERDALYERVKQRCPSQSLACYEPEFHDITMAHGPRAALDVFTQFYRRGEIRQPTDGHHIAHHVGHHTAMAFGPTTEAFALCPTDYNFGCLHGFFQEALGARQTTPEEAVKICEAVEADPSISFKHKTYCYHGLGHGVMMYHEHDLLKALPVCDGLPSPIAVDGCWQGVFMENINAAQQGTLEPGLFSRTDPLAPCNGLEPRYRHQCFINHAGWLITFYQRDLAKAAQACLSAPEGSVTTCLESLGLMSTNPEWQSSLLQVTSQPASLHEYAWAFCQRFPAGHTASCVFGAVDNLMNFDHLQLARSERFCLAIDRSYRDACFRRIGLNLRNLVTEPQAARAACQGLSEAQAQQACLGGYGPSPEGPRP